MRGTPVIVATIILLVPLASGIGLHSLSKPVDERMSDADLLRAIAAKDGLTLPPVALASAAPSDIPALMTELAARSGASLSPEDITPFLALDARVQIPVATLLGAVSQAWDLRDRAVAKLTPEEQLELIQLAREDSPDPARGAELVSQVEREYIFAAAILLLDTTENIVTPALQQAVATGAWPATATADPVGILRLGGTGNDVETIDRLIQIDPAGNDLYRNNAGATNYNDLGVGTPHPLFPVSISIDFAGDDTYIGRGSEGCCARNMEAQGGAALPGVGIILDLAGTDQYRCADYCQGTGARAGIGYQRDYAGNDFFTGDGLGALGYAWGSGVGVHRNDVGDDTYQTATGGGVADDRLIVEPGVETGILWDRSGSDRYENFGSVEAFGFAFGWGRGWLADEGSATDFYGTASLYGPMKHGCNDCTWAIGLGQSPIASAPGGRGADNSGGLPRLLSEDP